MMLGQFDYSIDTKGRLNFPAKFREEMGEKFVVTRWLDQCLVVFREEDFDRMADTLSAKGMVKSREIQRFLFSAADEVEPDSHGRILINGKLRKHAGLEKDVTIIGMRRYAEIWDTARWEAHDAALNEGDVEAAMEELDF